MAGRSGEIDNPVARHPGVGELIGYVRGDMNQERAGAVRAHAAGCRECGDQLAALILLNEYRLNADDVPALQATVTRFPVPVRKSARPWRVASAAAAVLILALAWFTWPAQVDEQQRFVAEDARPAIDFEAVAGDVDSVMAAVEVLAMRFEDETLAAVDGPASGDDVIPVALRAIISGDLPAARTLLAPYGQRWERYGTAVLGYILYLQEDPAAYAVLEMYIADHPTQVWDSDAEMPESLAFLFAARLRHARDDEVGARAAVAWIEPRTGAGPTATRWLRDTLGDDAAGTGADIQSEDSLPPAER